MNFSLCPWHCANALKRGAQTMSNVIKFRRGKRIPFGAISSTFRATRSQPLSLLSIARLKRAKSRHLSAICSWVRIAQICFRCNGGSRPISLPLFQGGIGAVLFVNLLLNNIRISLVIQGKRVSRRRFLGAISTRPAQFGTIRGK